MIIDVVDGKGHKDLDLLLNAGVTHACIAITSSPSAIKRCGSMRRLARPEIFAKTLLAYQYPDGPVWSDHPVSVATWN